MKLRVFYLFWVCVAGQSVSGQPSLPPIPNNDYDVYSVVVNAFSACIDMRRAYQRGQLVFVTTTTAVQDKNGFRFNASELQATINKTNGPQPTNQFQKGPGWVYFLNSVNTTQFTQYELKQLPQFACRQSAWWTDELQERYFGIEKVAGKSRMKGSGYGGLRTDYKMFGGIVSFSKVAYSLDGTKAFCYNSETSDGEAGAGYIVFFREKRNCLAGCWIGDALDFLIVCCGQSLLCFNLLQTRIEPKIFATLNTTENCAQKNTGLRAGVFLCAPKSGTLLA